MSKSNPEHLDFTYMDTNQKMKEQIDKGCAQIHEIMFDKSC